jgi:hypothetical protein
MKNYNKLPFKERKRQAEYSFRQTERQEEIALKKEFEELKRMKEMFNKEQEPMTDKVREEYEAFERLKALEEKTKEREHK